MLSASYTKGDNDYSTSAGAGGTIIALPDSLTFTAYQPSAYAAVSAGGARVLGYPNIVLNGSKRVIVPNLNP